MIKKPANCIPGGKREGNILLQPSIMLLDFDDSIIAIDLSQAVPSPVVFFSIGEQAHGSVVRVSLSIGHHQEFQALLTQRNISERGMER